MLGWFCPIHVIHLIRRKYHYFEKTNENINLVEFWNNHYYSRLHFLLDTSRWNFPVKHLDNILFLQCMVVLKGNGMLNLVFYDKNIVYETF